jgi:hypothetical protein
MSYTEVYRIGIDKTIETIEEYKNSHGFGPFVWSAISQKYFNDEFGWMSNEKEIWPLWKDSRLPIHWRSALLVTYDNAIIEYMYFQEISKYLKLFVSDVGKRDRVCHLLSIAKLIEESTPCFGFCFYGTSLSDDPWYEYDSEKEEYIQYDFSKGTKHFFVGESLKLQKELVK